MGLSPSDSQFFGSFKIGARKPMGIQTCFRIYSWMIWLMALSFVARGAVAEEKFSISAATTDSHGFLTHEVRSSYQSGTTLIRVLVPDNVEPDKKYPVVYVLPVEAGTENRFGDGLREVRQRGLHKKYMAIFVAPAFSHLPWYADHPADPEIRQEQYFLKVVVPAIEQHYPAQAEANGRLLLGFSKSGWGAYSLLLRHPDQFAKAVAWDAPMMMDKPGLYGSGPIFGSQENFDAYRITTLLSRQAEHLQSEKRLVLLGYGNFRAEHERAHALMNELKIRHEYRDGPSLKHDWHSGWVEEAVQCLLGKAEP